MIYTMNATTEQAPTTLQGMKNVEWVLGTCLGCDVEVIQANQTKQVKDYSRYELAESLAQSHDKWHEEHFAEELQRAFESGKLMAKKTIQV